MEKLFIFLSALLTVCLTQDFAFPGIDEEDKQGEEPTRISDKRIPLMIPGVCPPNQLLYPGDQKHDWICDCGPGFLYYPPKDGCFKAYMQEPCGMNQILILPRNEVIPECVHNPCKQNGYVRYNGNCYQLGKTGEPCKPANEGGGIFGVNATTFELQCLEGGDSLSLINFPPNCPKGSRRGASRCRPEYRK